MTCKICNTRRPRRYCPGVEGEICPVCCATEREVTIACPLSCQYLINSRDGRPEQGDGREIPHPEIRIPPERMQRAEPFIVLVAATLSRAVRTQPTLLDSDLHAALAALVQTYKMLDSGLSYQSKPENQYAAEFYGKAIEYLAEVKGTINAERPGALDDKDIFTALVMVHRLAARMDNRRPKGRAFIHWLHLGFKDIGAPAEQRVVL